MNLLCLLENGPVEARLSGCSLPQYSRLFYRHPLFPTGHVPELPRYHPGQRHQGLHQRIGARPGETACRASDHLTTGTATLSLQVGVRWYSIFGCVLYVRWQLRAVMREGNCKG